MKNFKGFLWVLLVAEGLSFGVMSHGFARDLQGRLGLGYNAQFSNYRDSTNGTPAIGAKYAFTKDLAAEGVLGFSTGSQSNSVIGAKFFKNLFYETSLNFYYMLAFGIVKANNRSGIDLQSGFGAEFFIPGVESVGISFETGAELTNISGSMVFRTLGLSFLHAGMRFYF